MESRSDVISWTLNPCSRVRLPGSSPVDHMVLSIKSEKFTNTIEIADGQVFVFIVNSALQSR